MEELFIYILKSSGLIVSFFLAYHFLLRKETFFNNNRWFLLSGLFISATLPLYFIKKIVLVEKPKLSVEDLLVMANHSEFAKSYTEITPQVQSTNWFEIAFIGYLVITVILFIKVVFELISLFKLLNKNKIEKQNGLSYIDLQKNIAPFSFFNFIVFNSSLYSQKELESILSHENVHSKQKHTFDVLFAKLFTIIFWFNPFIWLYKKAIIQNLEYIADNQAIQLIEDKKCYQMALLKVVSHQSCLPITNNFYQSLIKKRIVMLNKNQSHKRNIWKYTLVIPALIAFVILFQVKIVAQQKEVRKEVNNAVVDSAKAVLVQTVTNKNATDNEMKEDSRILKEQHGIDYTFSNIKRNHKGEITAIKIEFDDHRGHKGISETNGDEPIEPIYFTIDEDKIGFSDANDLSEYDYPSPPTPPSPPSPPTISIPEITFPNLPKAPNSPSGTPLTNEKEWKKFEKKMQEFEKKMKALEPEIEAYTEKMAIVDEQMKPFEIKMKDFEEKMEIYEIQVKKYNEQMDSIRSK